MKLTQKQNKTILGIIDDLFWTLKANWLGRFFKGPKIYFEIVDETNPMETLEGIYTYTKFMINGPNYKVNKQDLKQISDILNTDSSFGIRSFINIFPCHHFSNL